CRGWIVAQRKRHLVARAEASDAVQEQIDAIADAVAGPAQRGASKALVFKALGAEAPERGVGGDARNGAVRRQAVPYAPEAALAILVLLRQPHAAEHAQRR